MMGEASQDLLSRVLPSCFKVTDLSKDVQIEKTRLPAFAASLASALPKGMRHTAHHFIGSTEETVAYFVVLDTLNFGSGFFEHLAPYKAEPGYYAVASALRDWFARDGAPSPGTLKAMTPNRIAELLAQQNTPELSQLMTWFSNALRELGQFTDEILGGKFEHLLTRSKHKAPEMVALLCRMPMFRDEAMIGGREIYFLKRAQICVQDISIAAAEDGLGALQIDELNRLTVFADNMLPFILEAEGLLTYSDSLSQRIQRGEDLGMGSQAEIELRANSIVACELLRRNLADKGVITTAREIDFALWNIGDRQAGAGAKRLHVCRSYFY